MKIKSLIPLIPVGFVILTMMFSHSCANTTQAPSGGPKDTIPPTLLKVYPLPGQKNVPIHNTEIVFTFDEYVVIKESKNIQISPPPEKAVKSKLRGKSVVVTMEDDLLPNTTYSVDITNAIADNNEGNMFAGYTLVFSTGEQIDSMYMTGLVQDCATLNPVKGAVVMLYKDHADSAIFLHRPDAVAKTDDWGYFCLRNIQDTLYRLYALKDDDNNYKYNSDAEKVAFCDSTVKPHHKVAPGIYELYKFDMKDTAACQKRIKDHELNMFMGIPSKQAIRNKGRTGERSAFVSFTARFPKINSLTFKGVSKKNTIIQPNITRDSILLWVKDRRKQPDTLLLNVDYMKTDSTGKLVRTVEKLKLAQEKKNLSLVAMKSAKKNIKHEDTIAVYKVEANGETFEQYGIRLNFESPLTADDFSKLKYQVTNPKQQTSNGKYTWEQDTTDLRCYIIKHSGKILHGYEYKLTVPHRQFRDIYGHYNDSTVVKIKLPDDDKLSTLTINLSSVSGHYIVDLMTEKRDKIIRGFSIDKAGKLVFPYLKAGKYCIRITEDKNGNNLVETGDLLMHKQPEKVRFFKLPKGDNFIDIPEAIELSQDIDLAKMFK